MNNLQIEISIAAIVLLILIIIGITKNRMSIRNSIAWFLLPVVFFLIAIFPAPIEIFAKWLGFETLSNFIFLVVIALLILICFFLTVSHSHAQAKITKLTQEIALIKKQVSDNEHKK